MTVAASRTVASGWIVTGSSCMSSPTVEASAFFSSRSKRRFESGSSTVTPNMATTVGRCRLLSWSMRSAELSMPTRRPPASTTGAPSTPRSTRAWAASGTESVVLKVSTSVLMIWPTRSLGMRVSRKGASGRRGHAVVELREDEGQVVDEVAGHQATGKG